MFNATRHLTVLFAAAMLATPACAAGVAYPQRYPSVDRDDRAYYNQGMREGRESGIDDARRGREYDMRRHSEYRDDRRGDDRGDARAFRDGFETGYDQGYRQYARGGYWGDDSRRPLPPQPNSSQGPYYGAVVGRYGSPAAEIGYRDGLSEGQHAARDRDRFDPLGEKRYRDGDHEYDRRYGSRDEYRHEYRAAFQQGYEAGFRNYRR